MGATDSTIGVYAATGVTIPSGSVYVFTGNFDAYGANTYEVGLPPMAGAIAHGLAVGADITDAAASYDSLLLLNEPQIATVNAAVSGGQLLSSATDGRLQPRANFQAVAAIALEAASGAGPIRVLPFSSTVRTPAAASPTTSDPTSTATSDTALGEMSATLTLRLGTGVVTIGSANVELQPGDDVELSIYCTPAGGTATALWRRQLVNDAGNAGPIRVSVPLSTRIPFGSIPDPTATSHAFEVRAKKNGGTVRYVGLRRFRRMACRLRDGVGRTTGANLHTPIA